MKKYILLILSLFQILFINSQNIQDAQKTVPEITKPSPDMQALGRYGDIPMNMYTGIANINIPLYEFDFDGLKIPINITYNTTSPTVDQESTWIGLGWTLSCEPVIVREIRGLSDIDKGGIAPTGVFRGFLYTDIKLPTMGGAAPIDLVQALDDGFSSFRYQGEILWDTEPDIFTINIFGETASFIFIQKAFNNGKVGVKFINADKRYKIDYDEAKQEFVVTNDAGFKFYFTVKEYSMVASYSDYQYTPNPNRPPYITGWKLSKIVSDKGSLLNFEYNKASVTQTLPTNSRSKYMTASAPNMPDKMDNILSSFIIGNQTYYLYKISCNYFTVDFITGERKDIANIGDQGSNLTILDQFLGLSNDKKTPPKLEKITINNYNEELVKEYTFEQSYFNEYFLSDKTLRKNALLEGIRLKLDRIKLNNILYREFTYINPNKLAIKGSETKDLWGYYNGTESDKAGFEYPIIKKAITYIDISTIQLKTETLRSSQGSNRLANGNYSKIGLLEKVVYPTGGYTLLEYEPNNIKIDDKNEADFAIYEMEKSHKDIQVESSSVEYIKYSDVFEIKRDTKQKIHFKFLFGVAGDYSGNLDSKIFKAQVTESDKGNIAYQIIDVTNNTIIKTGYFTQSGGKFDTALSYSNTNKEWNIHKEIIALPKGKYKIRVQALKSISNFYDQYDGAQPHEPGYGKQYNFWVKGEVEVPYLSTVESYSAEVGGQRIKSISNFNNNDSLLTKKEYSYTLDDGSSSGVLIKQLLFWDITSKSVAMWNNVAGGPNPASRPFVLTVYSNNMSDSRSQNIGYSMVKESSINKKDLTNNGFSISEFYNYPDQHTPLRPDIQLALPAGDIAFTSSQNLAQVPYKYSADINGKLKNQKFYDQRNQKLKEIAYYYNNEDPNLPTIVRSKTAGNGIKVYLLNQYTYYSSFSYEVSGARPSGMQTYKILTEDISLIKKVETDYMNNDSITKTTIYNYNDQYQPSLIKESLSDAGNKYRETSLKYPFDLKVSSPYKEMVEKNILEPLVEKNIKNNIAETSNKINYSLTNNLYLPANEQVSFNGVSNLSTELTYDKYDSSGNLLQYTGKDDVSTSYLWSYKGQYPVAEIKNATYAQVQTALGIDPATISSLAQPNMTIINALRTKLPNAMVTTYTYKPLVGMLTVTDPAGVTTYYEYDSFNRLKETYIMENGKKRVVEAYNYHYANQ